MAVAQEDAISKKADELFDSMGSGTRKWDKEVADLLYVVLPCLVIG